MRIVLVLVGGGLGAVLRYLIDGWAGQRLGIAFPYGTFLINVSGSFLLGVLSVFTLERLVLSAETRIFLGVGLLGAFTTFSTWQYESYRLIEAGSFALAFANLFGSVVAGFFALVLGLVLGRVL
jgi:CrcB protein